MLDKLLISNINAEGNKTLTSLLISTSFIVSTILILAMVLSLFSQNLALGPENLNISELIAPPIIPENVPPKRKQSKPKNLPNSSESETITTRREIIQRVTESPSKVPKEIATKPSNRKARPNSPFVLKRNGGTEANLVGTGRTFTDCKTDCSDDGILKTKSTTVKPRDNSNKRKGPEIKPPPTIKRTKKKTLRTTKILNGKAKALVKPKYPTPAKTLGVSGQVTVQVTIDERGNVVSAGAVKGHPLLRSSAVRAARASKFTPTILGDSPVKVTGLIVYNFKP